MLSAPCINYGYIYTKEKGKYKKSTTDSTTTHSVNGKFTMSFLIMQVREIRLPARIQSTYFIIVMSMK